MVFDFIEVSLTTVNFSLKEKVHILIASTEKQLNSIKK
jgi:hypothetical protein